MKYCYLILFSVIFFALEARALDFVHFPTIDNAHKSIAKKSGLETEKLEAQRLKEFTILLERASKAKKTEYMNETLVERDCSHCPKHLKLSGDINSILEVMKKDPKLAANDEIPVSINRLNFMFFQIKSIEEGGSRSCIRYLDRTMDLKPTDLDGDMELMAEDVFKFEGISSIQLMDPKKEEIIYYYRGEGLQKNIIVQAVLKKEGGKFRYYYYNPSEKEKNPFNLPSLSNEVDSEVSLKRKKTNSKVESIGEKITQPSLLTPEDKIASKNKYMLDVDPKLETRLTIIPKNVKIAKALISHNIGGVDGFRLGADSDLSLKGNTAVIQVADEAGYQYVKVDLLTNLNGETSHSITIPYEVRLFVSENKHEAMTVKGNIVDSTTAQIISLSLTDSLTTLMRSEFKRDKITNMSTYAIAKDFSINKGELATVAVGSNELKSKYVSFQHRKAIKDTITMILDVRIDDNRNASLTYQFNAKF